MLTLLLNSSFEPIRLICWQRAITLCYLNKAEVLEEFERPIRSSFISYRQPAVIRLLKFHQYVDRVKLTKEHIFARDEYTCQYCGKPCKKEDLTVDHVMPHSRGGGFKWGNLVAACQECNNKKGARTPEEAEMPLLKMPVSVNWMPKVIVQTIQNKQMPSQWANWISWVGG